MSSTTSPAPPETGSKGPRASAVLVGAHRAGAFIFGVVAKRTYLVTSVGCQPSPEQVPLVEEPQFSAEEGILDHDTDCVLQRERADIIVQGHAYSPGRRAFETHVRVGDFLREVYVFGDRRVERHAGSLRFTPPEPIDKVPLSWEHAYGGVDEVARRTIGDPLADAAAAAGLPQDPRFGLYAYPRNPMGRGYLIEPTADAIEACRLPNFEEPKQLLTPQTVVRGDFMRWPTGPVVASMGWLSHNYFPRIVQMGLPPAPYNDAEIRPQHFFEVAGGFVHPQSVEHRTPMRDRVDHRASQQAAIGMRALDIRPGANVELLHLHPRQRSWRFSLPTDVPRMAYRLPGKQAAQLAPRIRTVLFEPDLDRVTLVWVGETQVGLPITPKQLQDVQHGVVWP